MSLSIGRIASPLLLYVCCESDQNRHETKCNSINQSTHRSIDRIVQHACMHRCMHRAPWFCRALAEKPRTKTRGTDGPPHITSRAQQSIDRSIDLDGPLGTALRCLHSCASRPLLLSLIQVLLPAGSSAPSAFCSSSAGSGSLFEPPQDPPTPPRAQHTRQNTDSQQLAGSLPPSTMLFDEEGALLALALRHCRGGDPAAAAASASSVRVPYVIMSSQPHSRHSRCMSDAQTQSTHCISIHIHSIPPLIHPRPRPLPPPVAAVGPAAVNSSSSSSSSSSSGTRRAAAAGAAARPAPAPPPLAAFPCPW